MAGDQTVPQLEKVTRAPLSTDLDDPRVRNLVDRVNRHARSDETVEDIVEMGKALSELTKILHLSKAQYARLGLKPQYSWCRRLIKIGEDPKTSNRNLWPHFPATRTGLLEIMRMTERRVLQGVSPDPQRNGEVVIHPADNRAELRAYRMRDEGVKPAKPDHYLLGAIPRRQQDWEEAIEELREAAFGADCDFVIMQVTSRKLKETVFATTSEAETIWTLRQVGRIEKKPRGRED